MYTTLISAAQLKALQTNGAPLAVFDCTFDLMNPTAGHAQYVEQHIAGAQHADLDLHLATPRTKLAKARMAAVIHCHSAKPLRLGYKAWA